MLDSYHKHRIHNNLSFNSINGTLVKSHPDSWFERYHLKSELSEQRLRRTDGMYTEQENAYITLQTMIVGDMEVLCEVVLRKDYLPDKEETNDQRTKN